MKSIAIYLASGAVALSSAMSVSCQKEELNVSDGLSSEKITRSMIVSQYLWGGVETRTVFEQGAGLHITGNESVSVYYSQYQEEQESIAGLQSPVEAIPTGNGAYTFSHDAIAGADAYNYGFVMPHSDANSVGNSTPGAADRAAVRLSPVQFPGNDDIDATNDYLIGRAQENVALSGELEVTEFKRLFAPLRLVVTDNAGLLSGEKLHTATLSFDKAASGVNNSIIGYAYLAFSNDYDESEVASITSASRSNAVSAVFDGGIENSGTGYPVWLMVNPISMEAGVSATLTVSTDTKTVSRTVALPSEMTFMSDKLNELTFDISGSGVMPPETSVTQSFVKLGSASPALTASDGNRYEWNFDSSCRFNYGDGENLGLRLNGGTVTLPTFPGRTLTGVRLFSHKRNGGTSTSSDTDNIVTIMSGEDMVATGNFNYFAVSGYGGVLDLAIPEEYASSRLVLSSNATGTLISAITFLFDESDPDAPSFTSVAPTDAGYENLYLGREVTVTGRNLADVTAFVVDGVEAAVTGTPADTEAHFVMPTTISGTSAKSVTLSAVTSEGTTVMGTITVYPFYHVKGLRLGVGTTPASSYSDDARNKSFLMLNEGTVIPAQQWVDDKIDPFALQGTNPLIVAGTVVDGASESDYDSVSPYLFLLTATSDGKTVVRFVNPANSTSQLNRHFTTDNVAVSTTYGTPLIKFRVLQSTNTNQASVKSAVAEGRLDNILAVTSMSSANTAAFGTTEGSNTWLEGSVISIQYINFDCASAKDGVIESYDDVRNQGYIYIREVTCASADGVVNEDRTGYVEFDLYWSNPLN